ncbi:putative hydroxypyruvate isomerase [Planococcus citri]|uniref:putative hydroxypyruvate isomerase n=1 Tax=Planococcus citri TaxID=170843 RepID=UPI0031F87879
MSLKICANLSFMFTEASSLLERYVLAKQCGFSAVECGFPYEYSINELQQSKESAQLEQILINVYPGNISSGELGFAAIPDKVTEFRNSIQLAVTYAKALNCSRIHVMAGIVHSPTTENDDVYLTNLKYASELFEKENITGLIEPINPHLVPGYYLNDYKKAVSIIKEVNSPSIKLMLDLFHLQMITGNLTNNIKNLLPYTGHIQIAQAPHRHEPDSVGEVNYKYVFGLLKQLNYDGWIGTEYTPAADTKSGLKWMDMLKNLD